MTDAHFTLGELRQRLAAESEKRDHWPVLVQTVSDDGYVKAYLTSVQAVHDNLPDKDGGDDIDNAAFVIVLEGELPEQVTDGG